jgi:hypothetical protein
MCHLAKLSHGKNVTKPPLWRLCVIREKSRALPQHHEKQIQIHTRFRGRIDDFIALHRIGSNPIPQRY